MRLAEALAAHPQTAVFIVTEHEGDEWLEWNLEPTDWRVVPDTEEHDFLIIRGLHVTGPGQAQPCYLDLCLPERLVDYAFLPTADGLRRAYPHELPGEVIPAVAMEGFGQYEQFYSYSDPEVGINVLRNGLQRASQKANIAQDLGYILRDEGRTEEAAAAFSVAIEEGPSNAFIYEERADLYEALGRNALAEADRAAAERMRQR
jgi:tetratricopeptide (TPR) repeat protein